VAQQGPSDVGVFELLDGDLAGESAVGLVEDVLRGDFEARTQVLAGEEEVEGWGRDDDFGVGVDFGVVEVFDDGFDGVDVAVPGGLVLGWCFLAWCMGGMLFEAVDCSEEGWTYILKLPPTKN